MRYDAFSQVRNLKRGKSIYNQWFRSFDDSEGYLNRLSDGEREEYKKNLFRSITERSE
jgi:hypothetical protein